VVRAFWAGWHAGRDAGPEDTVEGLTAGFELGVVAARNPRVRGLFEGRRTPTPGLGAAGAHRHLVVVPPPREGGEAS